MKSLPRQKPFRHERFLACISSNHEIAQNIIRKTAQAGILLQQPMVCACTCKRRKESADKIPLAAQRHLINNFKNATELGAEVIQKKEDNIARAIIEA